MGNNFLFDAPTYLDFNLPDQNEDCGNVETYFDIEHENTRVTRTVINSDTSTPNSIYADIPSDSVIRRSTSLGDIDATLEINSSHSEENKDIPNDSVIRRSTSLGDFDATQDINSSHNEENIEISENTTRRLRTSISADNLLNLQDFTGNASHASYTRKNVNDRINVLAQPKLLTQPKYISTAEQINKFYGTPTRFHTWKKNVDISNKQWKPHTAVIPESPALITKLRRRNNNALTRDEIEKQEMEELKKFKIKARPVNQKVLQGPIKPVAMAKRPTTIVKPFKLSENPSKKTENTSDNIEHYEFHARPIPKAIYGRSDSETKLEYKQKRDVTVSESNDKLKTQAGRSTSLEKAVKSTKLTQTIPVPYSFEKRDLQGVKRREALISKVLEKEKEAREFRANPLPKFLAKKSTSLNNLKTIKPECDVKEPPLLFKAKPPTVLYQKPFEPKKPERFLVDVTEVSLNTDRRAKEREDFEKKKQEKMEQMAILKLQKEIQQTRFEDEEFARLRKQTVHTAQPIRIYKEVKIVPSGQVTKPVTPILKTLQRRKIHNKENSG